MALPAWMAKPTDADAVDEGACCDPKCTRCRRGQPTSRRAVLFFAALGGMALLGRAGGVPDVLAQAAAAEPEPAAVKPPPAQARPVTARALLEHPGLALDDRARADLEGRGELAARGGRLDPVLLDLLGHLLADHTLSVVVFATGHSRYVAGTRNVSMHYTGQAMDVGVLDGQPVSRDHAGAYDLVTALARRSEVTNLGHPWPGHPANPKQGVFSDADHTGHLHIGVRR